MEMDILQKTTKEAIKCKSPIINNNLKFEYTLGSLLAVDNNALNIKCLTGNQNDYLLNLTRDNVQLLINKVWELPKKQINKSIMVRLPRSRFTLPRSTGIRTPKPLKCKQFPNIKGIRKKNRAKRWIQLNDFKHVFPVTKDLFGIKKLKETEKAKNDLQHKPKKVQATLKVGSPSNREKEMQGTDEQVPRINRKRKLPCQDQSLGVENATPVKRPKHNLKRTVSRHLRSKKAQ